MKFVLHFTTVKVGIFSDTVFDGSEFIEADTLEHAYEKAYRRAEYKSIKGRILYTVTNVEVLPTLSAKEKKV